MKKLLLASTCASAFAVFPALAADLPSRLPVKAPDPIHVSFSWTGCYAGMTAGYGWANADYDGTPNTVLVATAPAGSISDLQRAVGNTLKPSGFTGGVGAGCNWQTGGVVFGLETDFMYTDFHASTIRGTFPTTGSIPHTWEESMRSNYVGTVRGRLGVPVAPTHLLYITGGLSYGHFEFSKALDFPGTSGFRYEGSASQTKVGWTIGGGYEMVLTGAWTAKIDYLYIDLGHLSANAPQNGLSPTNAFTYKTHLTESLVRVGLNYKFGGR